MDEMAKPFNKGAACTPGRPVSVKGTGPLLTAEMTLPEADLFNIPNSIVTPQYTLKSGIFMLKCSSAQANCLNTGNRESLYCRYSEPQEKKLQANLFQESRN
jgi:hypothetical protein